MQSVKLKKIAQIERAQSGKDYPANTVLIQLSACDGMIYLHPGGAVDSRFCCIVPNELDGRYLLEALCQTWPAHYARTQQGINYAFRDVGECPVRIHMDPADRAKVVSLSDSYEAEIEQVRQKIEMLHAFKRFMLDRMVV